MKTPAPSVSRLVLQPAPPPATVPPSRLVALGSVLVASLTMSGAALTFLVLASVLVTP